MLGRSVLSKSANATAPTRQWMVWNLETAPKFQGPRMNDSCRDPRHLAEPVKQHYSWYIGPSDRAWTRAQFRYPQAVHGKMLACLLITEKVNA